MSILDWFMGKKKIADKSPDWAKLLKRLSLCESGKEMEELSSAIVSIGNKEAVPALVTLMIQSYESGSLANKELLKIRMDTNSLVFSGYDSNRIPAPIKKQRQVMQLDFMRGHKALHCLEGLRAIDELQELLTNPAYSPYWDNFRLALSSIEDSDKPSDSVKGAINAEELDVVEHTLKRLRANMGYRDLAEPLVEKLGELKDIRAVNLLLTISSGGQGVDSRNFTLPNAAKLAIISFGDLAVPVLKEVFLDATSEDRHTALELLAKLEQITEEDTYMRALEDKDRRVQCVAARVLGRVKCTRAVPTLLGVLQKDKPSGDKHDWVRIEIIKALREIKDTNAVKPLVGLLEKEDDYWLLVEVIEALVAFGDPQSFDELLLFAQRRTRKMDPLCSTESLARALKKTAGPSATDRLLESIAGDHDFFMTDIVVKCLEDIGQISAIERLLEIAREESKKIHIETGKAVGTWSFQRRAGSVILGAGPALSALLAILKRELEHVADKDLRAIIEMGPIASEVYLMNIDNDDGDTKIFYLDTKPLKELASAELARRER